MNTKENFNLENIERLENKYLEKISLSLSQNLTLILEGLNSQNVIKKFWSESWKKNKSLDFGTGAERIFNYYLDRTNIGKPNSVPVGSDLVFEETDSFIHIDLKMVNHTNFGDINGKIFIGENQNSYKSHIFKNNERREIEYLPNLPYSYTINSKTKITLSYFIVVLYKQESLEPILIFLSCMPNGLLEKKYGNKILACGKNPGKARFNYLIEDSFLFLKEKPRRNHLVYFDEKILEIKANLKIWNLIEKMKK